MLVSVSFRVKYMELSFNNEFIILFNSFFCPGKEYSAPESWRQVWKCQPPGFPFDDLVLEFTARLWCVPDGHKLFHTTPTSDGATRWLRFIKIKTRPLFNQVSAQTEARTLSKPQICQVTPELSWVTGAPWTIISWTELHSPSFWMHTYIRLLLPD